MTKSVKPTHKDNPAILAIDIGGSNLKIKSSATGEERKVASGPEMTAADMVKAVKVLSEGIDFDVVSIGYPGAVADNQPTIEPVNLGSGWVDHDFTKDFGRPVKIVNDAFMQAIGSYEGGRMLFLGLGTGLGAALIMENVGQPMELAHLPYRKKRTFEDYVGKRGLIRRGRKKWRRSVFDVTERLYLALQPDYIVIGGGNVDELSELPPHCRRGDNKLAFQGGFRLWTNTALVV